MRTKCDFFFFLNNNMMYRHKQKKKTNIDVVIMHYARISSIYKYFVIAFNYEGKIYL